MQLRRDDARQPHRMQGQAQGVERGRLAVHQEDLLDARLEGFGPAHQQLVPGTSAGTVQVLIENLTGTAGEWHGWGSSVDNQSGDAWSQIAFGGGQ